MVHLGTSPVQEENNVNILSSFQTFVLIEISVNLAEYLNANSPGSIPVISEIPVVKYLGMEVNN